MNKSVNLYFELGCGRCDKMATPLCKVHLWDAGLADLREIVLSSGLKEELKWGHPCYEYKGKNLVMIAAYKDFMALSFLQGALLRDESNLLERQGENTQSARILRWDDSSHVSAMRDVILAYIAEAKQVQDQGLKVAQAELVLGPEWLDALAQNAELKQAFEALTPGRQRAYVLYVEGAKQEKTRKARIEKWIPAILAGKGMND